jgi:DNA-binding transcriptional ArsR family regulator
LIINAMVDDLGRSASPVDGALAALAEPTRRRVVELLGDRPHRASELADRSGTTRAAMSRHLRVLRATGMVDVALSELDARERVYRLRADQLGVVRAWLDEVQAHWDRQLGAFRAHVERSGPGEHA